MGGGPRDKLWDRDVVEMFLGDDWTNIRHYREFEIAPTGDWIDLAIDLDHESYDQSWRSGWTTAARIDEAAHVWYAAARIPLKRSRAAAPVKPGTKWRANLYRIEGQGPDARAALPVLAAHLRRQSRSEPCAGEFRHAGLRGRRGFAGGRTAAVRSALRRLPRRGRHGRRARARHRQRGPRAAPFGRGRAAA